jgi:hypothetical protein
MDGAFGFSNVKIPTFNSIFQSLERLIEMAKTPYIIHEFVDIVSLGLQLSIFGSMCWILDLLSWVSLPVHFPCYDT